MADDSIEHLVRDAAALTGGELPSLLSGASPTLALADANAIPTFYLIGLIGGKDVGKSSLANAIAGVTLCVPSNTGEGTRDAIAYVHRDVEADVRSLLAGIVPDRFDVIVHEHASLRSQVLIDLPDIDSKYQDHIDLTRSVLRHLLYPIFVQSIEKYADERPQRLLAQVAEGNDPANFLFCLNKVDQLVARNGADAASTLAADYGRRIGNVLKMERSPRVFCISAQQPDKFDLPALRDTLSRDRAANDVRRARTLATGRRRATLLGWLESQRLDERLARANRVSAEARELAEQKLLGPIDTRVMPRLRDEATLRAEIVEAASRKRIARWPIVNVVDVILAPIAAALRRNVLGITSSRQNVRAIVADLTPPLDANVRTLFADVRRRDPTIADVYGPTPPWDDAESELRVADLTTRLADSVERRRTTIAERAGRGHGGATAPLRWLLTFGAALWFPIIQPLASVVLNPDYSWTGWTWRTAWQLVSLFGTVHLLNSAAFLAIYFVVLWATLRYLTARRTERLIARMDADDLDAGGTTITATAEAWVDELFAPIEARSAELRAIVERVASARAAERSQRDVA
jgi:hypothetical protein